MNRSRSTEPPLNETISPLELTCRAVLSGRVPHNPGVQCNVSVVVTLKPTLPGRLINDAIVRKAGLSSKMRIAADKQAWRNIRGDMYYLTK